jgi:hypothetical protein
MRGPTLTKTGFFATDSLRRAARVLRPVDHVTKPASGSQRVGRASLKLAGDGCENGVEIGADGYRGSVDCDRDQRRDERIFKGGAPRTCLNRALTIAGISVMQQQRRNCDCARNHRATGEKQCDDKQLISYRPPSRSPNCCHSTSPAQTQGASVGLIALQCVNLHPDRYLRSAARAEQERPSHHVAPHQRRHDGDDDDLGEVWTRPAA